MFCPLMKPLYHIATKVDNTSAEGWAIRGSARSDTAVGPLLREAAWIGEQTQTHLYLYHITGEMNKEVDAESKLTLMPFSTFMHNFNYNYP